jgi:hypothetical protein
MNHDSIREKEEITESRSNDGDRLRPRDSDVSSMLISNVNRECSVGGTVLCQDVFTSALEVVTGTIECRVVRITRGHTCGPNILTLSTVSKADITLVEDGSNVGDSTSLT